MAFFFACYAYSLKPYSLRASIYKKNKQPNVIWEHRYTTIYYHQLWFAIMANAIHLFICMSPSYFRSTCLCCTAGWTKRDNCWCSTKTANHNPSLSLRILYRGCRSTRWEIVGCLENKCEGWCCICSVWSSSITVLVSLNQ